MLEAPSATVLFDGTRFVDAMTDARALPADQAEAARRLAPASISPATAASQPASAASR